MKNGYTARNNHHVIVKNFEEVLAKNDTYIPRPIFLVLLNLEGKFGVFSV